MRISDWSSDVCSSDLCIFQIVAVLASCIVDQYVDTAEIGADGGDEIDDRLLIGHVDMIGPGLPALCNDRCSIFLGLRHLDVDEGTCFAHSGQIRTVAGSLGKEVVVRSEQRCWQVHKKNTNTYHQ